MRRDLDALAGREHDVLVVGGGIVGAAAVHDAASRGLRAALVEAADFASGASWNSLKTIHGGLRHLQRADLPSLRESSRERATLLRIAPRLVRPLSFLVPAHGHGTKGREALAAAVVANNLLTLDRNRGVEPALRLRAGRVLSRRQVLDLAPEIAERGLAGGIEWTDAQVSSSERLLLGFLHAAAERGAALANHCELVGLERRGGAVVGARLRDRAASRELTVQARVVLNAAGPGMDAVLALAGLRRRPVPLLEAVNLVLGRPVVRTHAVGATQGSRFLFLVPWADRSIAGTAYEPRERGVDAAAFLEECREAFPWAGLEPRDVTLVHRGLVPARPSGALATRPLLVDHARADRLPGLVTVQAVKYTTARAQAEQAVDLVCRQLGRRLPCRTAEVPLARARPLDGPLAEAAREAVRDEMALHLSDAVLRRLDLGTAGVPDAAALDTVAAVLAAELGWSPDRTAAERAALLRTYPGPAGGPGPGYRMAGVPER